MNSIRAQKLCDVINKFLSKKHFYSTVDVAYSDGDYHIILNKHTEEELPNFLKKFVKKEFTTTKEYANNTENAPSEGGKWIDLPLSPANRHVDGPGGFGGLRREPELQDMVTHVANWRMDMNRLSKIARSLKHLAAVDRLGDVDSLLEEIANILSAQGFSAPKDKVMNLFNKLNVNYDLSVAPAFKEALKYAGFKTNHKVYKLLKAATEILKKSKLSESISVKDADKRKAAEEAIEFLKGLTSALPNLVRDLNIINLSDEANHVATLRADMVDILDTVRRALN